MNQKLQQAILATRAGRKKEAQLLLTQVLKEDPNEVQAWFLLSHIVESKQKQVAYLKKVVTLDPAHEKANQQLALLEPALSTPPVEGVVDSALDETETEDLPISVLETTMESPREPAAPAPESISERPLEPVSLTPTIQPEAESASLPPPVTAEAPTAPDSEEARRQRQALTLTLSLIGLVAAATVVFIALLYAIFSAF